MAKTPTKKTKVEDKTPPKIALKEGDLGLDMQSGMNPGADTETAKAAVAEQFKAADAKGEPKMSQQKFDDLQVTRSVRGW